MIYSIGLRDDVISYHWFTEPPTEGGWYWAWDGQYDFKALKIELSIRGYVVRNYHPDVLQQLDWVVSDLPFTHWLGPLPVPEAPGE